MAELLGNPEKWVDKTLSILHATTVRNKLFGEQEGVALKAAQIRLGKDISIVVGQDKNSVWGEIRKTF